MDISDFEGNFKFKLIIPALYVLNWIFIFLGPSVVPIAYQWYSIVGWIFMIGKMLYVNTNMLIILRRTYKTLAVNEDSLEKKYQIVSTVSRNIHCFIIPSYNEDMKLLIETL